MILPRKCLLVDSILTRSLSKSPSFCEFSSVNLEPCLPYTRRNRFVNGRANGKQKYVIVSSAQIGQLTLLETPNLPK